MIRNILATALRNLLANRGFTLLNICGLALGMTSFLLIAVYVADEMAYDRYSINAGRIFRVNTDLNYGGALTPFAIAAPPVGDALARNFPEVEKAVRLAPRLNTRFAKDDEVIQEDRGLYADPSVFEVFTLPMLFGNQATALTTPRSIVITESMAKKYFGRSNALGETLLMQNDSSMYSVTGVIRDIPSQTHFSADFFLSMHEHNADKDTNFNRFTFNTYLLLTSAAGAQALEAKLPDFLRGHLSNTMNMDQFEKGGNYIRIHLMPLTDIHLKSNRQRELAANGDMQYVYIFSAIAVLILVLACINFMNLSTARSASRAKEVGVRKVLGSSRLTLILQFLSESLLVTLSAAITAVIATWLLLPVFSSLAGKPIVISAQSSMWLLIALLVITLVVGVLAGSYPAFFLSGFQPVNVLKGKWTSGFKGSRLRSILVVFQFSIATFLVVGTLVIYNQLRYIHNKDLGFNREQVLIVKNVGAIDRPEIIRDQVKQLPGVTHTTLSGYLPTGEARWANSLSGSGGGLICEFWPVDDGYIPTMGMTMVTGRNFSKEMASDSSGIIINETSAAIFGYGDEPLEKHVRAGNNSKDYHVIGVVRDFNFNSLRDNVTPLVMVLGSDWRTSLSIRVEANHLPALLEQVKRAWKTLVPYQQLEYSFMDKDFEALYHTEQRMEKLFLVFTILAIVIACLGLFGLSAYAAEQRAREISIRKVLGATVSNLIAMLTMDFIKLVIISILVATPVAWYMMERWLQSFAYRDEIPGWAFAIASVGTLIIAAFTISFQSLKAGMVNPIDNLRAE